MKTLIVTAFAFFASSAYAQDISVGEYDVFLRVGEITHHDKLTITKVERGSVNGTFSVPGIFTVPMEFGLLQPLHMGTRFSFRIQAAENGKTYPVYFSARLFDDSSQCSIKGVATLPDSRQKLGDFEFRLVSPDCNH